MYSHCAVIPFISTNFWLFFLAGYFQTNETILSYVWSSQLKIGIGYTVDRIGAQICQNIGCVFVVLFSFTLGYVKQGKEYLVFLAFVFLGIGSSLLMLSCYQAANTLFKKNKALFLCLLSGSVDSSTAVFVLFLVAFESGHKLLTISFLYGCITVVFVTLTTVIIYPSQEDISSVVDAESKKMLLSNESTQDTATFVRELTASYKGGFTSSFNAYKSSIERTFLELSTQERMNEFSLSLSRSMGLSYSENEVSQSCESTSSALPWKPFGIIQEHVAGYGSDEYAIQNLENNKENTSLVMKSQSFDKYFQSTTDVSLKSCLFSKLNLLWITVSSLILLKLLYFIGNIDKYFANIADKETGNAYIKYFGLTQFVGILVGPLAGLLFQRKNLGDDVSDQRRKFENIRSLIVPSIVITANILLLNGLQLVQSIYLSIPLFLCYLTANGLVWCFASSFYGLLYPPRYFCTLYSVCMACSGIFSFLQYPLLTLEQTLFKGNQFWTNLVFFILLHITLLLPIALAISSWRLKKEMKDEPAKGIDNKGFVTNGNQTPTKTI